MGLLVADDNNFEDQLTGKKVIVKYYADWCGSCRLFAPKFKRLSNDEKYSGITFLDVNAESNPESRKKGAVKNLPSFAIFDDGKFVGSICTSKEEALVEFLEKAK
ncbi:MAG TPA: thioredoxin family protein [Cytophagaceae bacterium]|jgi:thiol-disulfide isomerase/thioredoxin